LYESSVQSLGACRPKNALCVPPTLARLQSPQASIARSAKGRVYGLRVSDLGSRAATGEMPRQSTGTGDFKTAGLILATLISNDKKKQASRAND